MMKGWYTRRKAPPPPITALTVVFFVLQWDTRTGNIKWSGVGKYVNYAFVCKILFCFIVKSILKHLFI